MSKDKVLPSFEIHFTTQNIGELEDKLGKGIYKIIMDMLPKNVNFSNDAIKDIEKSFNVDDIPDIKISVISAIVEKGARVSEQEAYKLIDTYILEEGGTLDTLAEWVIKKITNSGFLSKPRKERQSTQK